MSETTPMTQEGFDKLKGEADELEQRRPLIKKAIEEAREKGDLSENADYHAAREDLAMLNARLSDIHGKLASAVIVDPSKAPKGKVSLGNTVKLIRVTDGKEIIRTLVGAGEADVVSGKILTTSPIGAALIGHEVGDHITVNLPKGAEEFEIREIS